MTTINTPRLRFGCCSDCLSNANLDQSAYPKNAYVMGSAGVEPGVAADPSPGHSLTSADTCGQGRVSSSFL